MNTKSIRACDFRQAMRLVGECRELGDDLNQWRTHLMAGLARLVDADLVLHAGMQGLRSGQPAMTTGLAWGFENGFNLAGWLQVVAEYGVTLRSESLAKTMPALLASPGITVARQQILSNRDWDRSFDKQYIARTIGTEPLMQSYHWAAGEADLFDGVSLSRAAGRKLFSERETNVVYAVHSEISRWIGGPLIGYREQHPAHLPPRVRQVLKCLLEGDCDKQIALRLNISAYTVNQYTKTIYDYFHCSGRTELLARWLRRGWTINAQAWEPSGQTQVYV